MFKIGLPRFARSGFLCLALSALLVAGCGGGGGGSSSGGGGGGGGSNTQTGITKLNDVIGSTGAVDTSTLNSALADFLTATAADPNNAEANTGYAFVQSAVGIQNLIDLFGSSFDRSSNERRPWLMRAANLAFLTNIRGVAKGPKPLVPTPAEILRPYESAATPASRAFPDDPTPAQVQSALADLADDLGAALAALERAAVSDEDPLILVAPPELEGATNIKIGTAEVEAFAAAVRVLRAAALIGSSYDATLGGFDWEANLSELMPNSGEIYGPRSYLPDDPFFTLRAGGATAMQQAHGELVASMEDYQDMLDALEARTDEDFLIETSALEEDFSYDELRTQAQDLITYITEPYETEIYGSNGSSANVTVDLAAFFADPPADLSAFLPSVETLVQDDDESSTIFFIDYMSIEDKSFGGLFVDPLPDDLFGFDEIEDQEVGRALADFWSSFLSNNDIS